MKNTSFSSAGIGLTCVATAALLLVHSSASALSLGRLNVQSTLGEALRAEIDVASLTPEEADTLRAALASPEAFRAAGVEFNSALSGARASLARRADGRPVIRIAGDRAVTEPFIDVLLDLSWSSGRLQRAYTLLIDPPATQPSSPPPAAAPTAAPVMSAAPAAPATPPAAAQPAAPVQAAAPTRPAPRPAPVAEPKPTPSAEPKPAAAPSADGYRVRNGDTLSRIAGGNTRPGVSLDQMLVALYRGNPQAFVGNNMNRLKSGVVLDLAAAQANAGEVSAAEARRIIQAQSADFSAFRQRLAGAAPTVRSSEPARQAKGQVEAAVQDRKTDTTTAPDKLTLSKGGLKAANEAKLSKETERKAADARMKELARNVDELKTLSASAAKGTPPAVASAPVKPALPAVPVVTTPPPVPAPVVASAPAVAPPAPAVVASAPPVVASAVASAPAVQASAPVVASAPVAASAPSKPAETPAPQPTPVDEPGFLDSLSSNPFILPLGVGLVALLAGLGVMRLRRRQEGSGETSFIESKLQPDSFFGVSGGQRVDTADGGNGASSSSLSYSLSQLDAIGDVDPVAEADVYLAYGRDLQAEEILKEALRSDTGRMAIRTKLLEVYAKRADSRAFDQQAQQLHELTQGQGEDWARAAELGRQIDPDNPLYARPEGDGEPDGDASVVDSVQPAPEPVAPAAERTAPLDIPSASAAPSGPITSFDIDIDLDSPSQLTGLENTRPFEASRPASTGTDLPPDLADDSAQAPRSVHGLLDDEPVERTRPSGFDELAGEPAATGSVSLDDLPLEVPQPAEDRRDPPTSAPVDFDFGDLSLDLDSPAGAAGSDADLDIGGADPMARKIELADEFRRIGDLEGARDLLEEVIAKTDGPLRARAQSQLDEL